MSGGQDMNAFSDVNKKPQIQRTPGNALVQNPRNGLAYPGKRPNHAHFSPWFSPLLLLVLCISGHADQVRLKHSVYRDAWSIRVPGNRASRKNWVVELRLLRFRPISLLKRQPWRFNVRQERARDELVNLPRNLWSSIDIHTYSFLLPPKVTPFIHPLVLTATCTIQDLLASHLVSAFKAQCSNPSPSNFHSKQRLFPSRTYQTLLYSPYIPSNLLHFPWPYPLPSEIYSVLRSRLNNWVVNELINLYSNGWLQIIEYIQRSDTYHLPAPHPGIHLGMHH